MTPQEVKALVMLVRRAPLRDSDEADAVRVLLQKLTAHFAPKEGAPLTPHLNGAHGIQETTQ